MFPNPIKGQHHGFERLVPGTPSYSSQEQVIAMSTIETTPQLPVSVDDATTTTPASGQVGAPAPAAESGLEGFENWIKDFKKYESILVRDAVRWRRVPI